MLASTIEEALATGLPVELCGDPDPASWYDGPPLSLAAQGEGDLGRRLFRAAARAAGSVILIGTDCPALDRHRLKAAAEALATQDAVLHPAHDGGYVLLGLRRPHLSVFKDIRWSTAEVAAQTMARIDALGWSLRLGDTLHDVDRPQDLIHLPVTSRPQQARSGR
jgi:rSAM/selenodomain-associated transferase 1